MLASVLCTPALNRASSSAKTLSNIPLSAICAYTLFFALSWCVYDLVAERKWSSMMTMSGFAHCLGLMLLFIQVVSSRSAAGVSARALVLDGIAVSLRLSSTLFFEGYLPNDKSGDHVYQCADLCSLLLIVFLLRSVLVTHRDTYQLAEDDISIGPMVVGSILLGAVFHGDMDDHPIFDTLWLSGLFVSVVAVLPQYWMISKSCGQTQVLTAHYIAATAVDRILSGLFMWYVSKYITCIPWVGEFQHTIYVILGAHLVHLFLLSDFAIFYARCLLTKDSSAVDLVPQGYGGYSV
jgi:hypothetical protein